MNVPRVVVVLVVAGAVLAGCGSPGTDDAAIRTLTPVDVPETGTAPSLEGFPEGVTGDGITDPFRLVRTHHDALEGQSYAVTSVVTARYANGTLWGGRRTTVRTTANRSRFLVTETTRGPNPPFRRVGHDLVRAPGRSAFWSDGRRLLWLTEGDNVSYRAVGPGELDPREWAPLTTVLTRQELHLRLNAVETTVTGREQHDGTTLVAVRSTGRSKPGSAGKAFSAGAAYRYPLGIDRGSVSNVRLQALVSSGGIVHEHEFDYVAEVDGTRVTVTERVRYIDVGNTTVERPDWYEEAVAVTNATG